MKKHKYLMRNEYQFCKLQGLLCVSKCEKEQSNSQFFKDLHTKKTVGMSTMHFWL